MRKKPQKILNLIIAYAIGHYTIANNNKPITYIVVGYYCYYYLF